MRRGFGKQEILLSVGVLIVFGAIMLFLLGRVDAKKSTLAESSRMRQLFVGLTFYETDNNGGIAPTLLSARYEINDDARFTSDRDPFRKAAGPFPVDPGMPTAKLNSPIRISDSYLWSFVTAGKVKPPKQRIDSALGFIANEWMGEVRPGSGFSAQVSGVVFRVNMDGAFVRIDATPRSLGDASALFTKIR